LVTLGWMLGFETIGNATVICYDAEPILVTDPWIAGDAYFGSWGAPFEIPSAQRDAILRTRYVWLSHGHPDHTNAASLDLLSGRTILLPDHAGGRMARDLGQLGFSVRIMRDREWTPLSKNIKAMCIADYNQDAILLVDVGGRLLVDVNDAADRGWGRIVRKIIGEYRESFLLKLFGYGDADMINIFREDGSRLLPPAPDSSAEAKQFWDGYLLEKMRYWTRFLGVTHVIPFSMFHKYQRLDSIWAEAYRTPEALIEAAKLDGCEVLPSFVRFDCETGTLTRLRPRERADVPAKDPKEFGDDWSEQLDRSEIATVDRYFRSIGFLGNHLDYVRLRVGGKEQTIELNPPRATGRGVTFEVPRGSLMNAVQYEFFDDLLIGNFMKTTIHGDWGTALAPSVLYPHFTPWVTRYADNGGVKTRQQLEEYFAAYRKRAPFDYIFHRFEHEGARKLRTLIQPGSSIFRVATRTYSMLKRLQ
jgi:hypothetical protein